MMIFLAKGKQQAFALATGRERRNIMKFRDLFVPRWQHSNPSIRIKTVKSIFDPRLLKHISKQDEDPMVRETALSHLKNFEAQQIRISEQE
jgi:hypothetical protein